MQSDDLGLVERLRQSAELFEAVRAMHAGAECADAEPHWSSQAEAATAHDLASVAAAAIERLVAERDEAREALKPFAKRADEWPLNSDNARVSVRLYDLRRARQALKDAP